MPFDAHDYVNESADLADIIDMIGDDYDEAEFNKNHYPEAPQVAQNISEDAEVYDLLACPITSLTLVEPCVLADDTQTYSKHAITSWLADHDTSPMTREKVKPTLIPNKFIQKMIDFYNANPDKQNIEDYFAAYPQDLLKGELIITHDGNTYEKNKEGLVRNRLAEHVIEFYQNKMENTDTKTADTGPKPVKDEMMTPLHEAVRSNKYESVKNLLESGVDVNAYDSRGLTPLHYAAEKGYASIVKLLLAQDNIVVDRRDEKGETPLYKAMDKNKAGVAKLLLDAHADFMLVNNNRSSPYQLNNLRKQHLIDPESYWLKLRQDAESKRSKGNREKANKIYDFLDNLSFQERNHKVSALTQAIKGEGEFGHDVCRRMHSRFFTKILPKKKVTKHLIGLLEEIEKPTFKR